MKLTIAPLASLLCTLAVADNCKPGINYCGHSLLKKGNYQAQIDQCLYDNNQNEPDYGHDDLFHCVGGSNGVIAFIQNCGNGCQEADTNQSDFCL
ncbi:hypothetical protein F4678DRAFT_479698 [Xylaria arbuscula]|nr:hypothetical protein F4678DRAFT_479698 [Xylaria arbuscula]